MPRTICIGYDPREEEAYRVAYQSARECSNAEVLTIKLDEVREKGLYTRKHELRDGRMYDVISNAPMSTEFAISRFLTPELARRHQGPNHQGERGWAVFMDCDVLVRKIQANEANNRKRPTLEALFNIIEQQPFFAMACVKHEHNPPPGLKMDGQLQVLYARKNWSSVMAFNLDHVNNRDLTIKTINKVPGRDLHRFCWLEGRDDLIYGLDPKWNFLVGHSVYRGIQPHIVHFTEGVPTMPGYENCDYADEWRAAVAKLRAIV